MNALHIREFEFQVNSDNCFVRIFDSNSKIDFFVETSLIFYPFYDDEVCEGKGYNWVSSYAYNQNQVHGRIFDFHLRKPCYKFRFKITSVTGTDISGLVASLHSGTASSE